ncbi:MAG: hypothetical protein R3324_10965, partial [Halobacteriales archaeon]|nr:hypothetical protein [Halobacteriales archaeon]
MQLVSTSTTSAPFSVIGASRAEVVQSDPVTMRMSATRRVATVLRSALHPCEGTRDRSEDSTTRYRHASMGLTLVIFSGLPGT